MVRAPGSRAQRRHVLQHRLRPLREIARPPAAPFTDVGRQSGIGRAEAGSKSRPESKADWQYGAVEFDRATRLVTCFEEKRERRHLFQAWFNGGAYVLEHDILDYVAAGRPCSLEREVFPRVLAAGRHIATLASKKPFFDIGTPAGWREFRAFYLDEPGKRRLPRGDKGACHPPCSSTVTA